MVSVGESRDRRRWDFYAGVFYLGAGFVVTKSFMANQQASMFRSGPMERSLSAASC